MRVSLRIPLLLVLTATSILSAGGCAAVGERMPLAWQRGGGGDAPESFDQRLAKGRTLEASGKQDEARAHYEQLVADYPDRYETYHALAVLADRQRRFAQAQSLYERALQLKPDDAEILNDLGYCFYLAGQLDKAESALLKAVARGPAEPRYRNNLGLVYGHQRRMPEALACFQKAGSEADAQYNLAFVHASLGEAEAAKACFQQALNIDSSYTPARRALASFARFERDPEGLYEHGELVSDGIRYVPYVEGAAPAAAPAITPHAVAPHAMAPHAVAPHAVAPANLAAAPGANQAIAGAVHRPPGNGLHAEMRPESTSAVRQAGYAQPLP